METIAPSKCSEGQTRNLSQTSPNVAKQQAPPRSAIGARPLRCAKHLVRTSGRRTERLLGSVASPIRQYLQHRILLAGAGSAKVKARIKWSLMIREAVKRSRRENHQFSASLSMIMSVEMWQSASLTRLELSLTTRIPIAQVPKAQLSTDRSLTGSIKSWAEVSKSRMLSSQGKPYLVTSTR